jgi:3-phenylpropionate/trans-cinnamate dioxygenase ferredoxin component
MRPVGAEFVAVAPVGEVPVGDKREYMVGDRAILICHTNAQLYAVENRCSHANECLTTGRMKGTWIACPVHGARFDLTTGRAMNPPAKLPIQVFELRVVDGVIQVRV